MNEAILENIEIETRQPVSKSIIWLHGLGADGSDFVPIVPELRIPPTQGVRFIFPHAPIIPVTINNHYPMRAWFDITSMELSQKPDYARIDRSTIQVKKLIARENERGIASENIILAGFSQGGVLALAAGLTADSPLAGIIALSGCLVLDENHLIAAKKIPIFLGHGREDNVVPYQLSEIAFDILNALNFPITFKSYSMAHSVSTEEISDLSRWIQERFS